MDRKRELSQMSDSELLKMVSSDDRFAFNTLVERYGPRLYNFICRMVSDFSLAQDILQETLLRVYKKRGMGDRIRDFRSFVYAMAANLARDELRKQRRRVTPEDPQAIDCVGDESARPDLKVEKQELRRRIELAIHALPREQREVIVLRDMEGLSYEEVRRILGLRMGTVKSRLNRARLKLQEELGPYL